MSWFLPFCQAWDVGLYQYLSSNVKLSVGESFAHQSQVAVFQANNSRPGASAPVKGPSRSLTRLHTDWLRRRRIQIRQHTTRHPEGPSRAPHCALYVQEDWMIKASLSSIGFSITFYSFCFRLDYVFNLFLSLGIPPCSSVFACRSILFREESAAYRLPSVTLGRSAWN